MRRLILAADDHTGDVWFTDSPDGHHRWIPTWPGLCEISVGRPRRVGRHEAISHADARAWLSRRGLDPEQVQPGDTYKLVQYKPYLRRQIMLRGYRIDPVSGEVSLTQQRKELKAGVSTGVSCMNLVLSPMDVVIHEAGRHHQAEDPYDLSIGQDGRTELRRVSPVVAMRRKCRMLLRNAAVEPTLSRQGSLFEVG